MFISEEMNELILKIDKLDVKDKIKVINDFKLKLHKISPFKNEPVDCVIWVKSEALEANDYNPNKVAPPEMKLLELSINNDGYTQPIVSWQKDNTYEVVDGFHRHRVGRESKIINERIHNHLPIVVINKDTEDRGDRISSTIRHNRARGKHQIDAMSDIIIELKRRNWSDKKIGKNLGMDPDEVLRLAQITGLSEMFNDQEFTEAWEAYQINEDDDLRTENETDISSI